MEGKTCNKCGEFKPFTEFHKNKRVKDGYRGVCKKCRNGYHEKKNNPYEYRGIQLHESVRLYMKNGEYNKQVKNSLDEFADLLIANNHKTESQFKNVLTKILINFNCSHEPHWIKPNSYKNGTRCPKCHFEKLNKLAKKQSQKAKKEFLLLVERRGHKLLSDYINNSTKVLIDFQCGHEPHWIGPNHYNSKNSGCDKCGQENRLLKQKERMKKVEENFIELLLKNNHQLLSVYINLKTKVLIDFRCGHEPHWIRPESYKKGHGCPKCSGFSQEQAKKEFIKLVKTNGHILLTEYKSNKKTVLIDFRCGHKPHWLTPNKYKSSNRRCPECSQSKGVKIICEWLEKNNIVYKTEYRLPNKKWRYDIFIPSRNLIVEVHGIQHFKSIGYFKSSVKEQAQRDTEKWSYATSLKYEYLEVNYKEHKPELALERFLKAFNEFGPSEKSNTDELQLSLF